SDSASYPSAGGANSTGNRGRSYRNDGVDIRPDDQGYYVFGIEEGEWLQYTVNVQESGINMILLEVAGEKEGASVSVRIDELALTNPVPIPPRGTLASSGGSSVSWQHLPVGIPVLPKGKAVIRIQAEKGGFLFKSLAFSRR